MTPTPGTYPTVEQLGCALEALGWQAEATNDRAATRVEMIGLLRFIVEVAQFELRDDPTATGQLAIGYKWGLDAKARQGTSTVKERAIRSLTLWLNLITYNAHRAGSEVITSLEASDPVYDSAAIADALTRALLQMMRVPGHVNPATGQQVAPVPPQVLSADLEAVTDYMLKANRQLAKTQQKLRRSGL
ncbi:hypothetical protein ACF06W_11345 [Streptomyces albus]|uniref:hypothetical protein n=1 Tax=Streptomyces albus TaxID=1888 RepID=UPI0037018223